MRVIVRREKCQGHARCAAIAPDIFVLNDDGYIESGDIDVAAANEALARRGARACPERALEVEE